MWGQTYSLGYFIFASLLHLELFNSWLDPYITIDDRINALVGIRIIIFYLLSECLAVVSLVDLRIAIIAGVTSVMSIIFSFIDIYRLADPRITLLYGSDVVLIAGLILVYAYLEARKLQLRMLGLTSIRCAKFLDFIISVVCVMLHGAMWCGVVVRVCIGMSMFRSERI